MSQKTSKQMSVNQTDEIKNSIFRYLNIREHSKLELYEKLLKKNFKRKEIKECILEFEEKGLQSDKRYAELYAKSRFENQKGPYFIESNLRKNGVDKNIIRETLLAYSEHDWKNAAVIALEKKSLPKKLSTDKAKTEKQEMFLRTRGFGMNIIKNAINQFWQS
ncbi:MAG: RecX family transcriptional regulator [Pseudomonadota bacterium]|nr:RecX family transcriptional regulator [Pseudomonadota bacterium]